MNNAFPQAAIALIQSLGYDVYMRSAADSWCYFTDGNRIGYVQYHEFRGFGVSTVHQPSQQVGTGFHMGDAPTLNAEMLKGALIVAPSLAAGRDVNNVRKYRDMAQFLAASSFNKEYKLVEAVPAVD